MRAGNFWAVMILLSLLAVSCNQDPIFFIISKETAPLKPRIEGAPNNMVVFKREYSGTKVPILYVASGRLHWYAARSDGKPQWDLDKYYIPQPGGKIIALAADANRLYALCWDGNDVNMTLRYIESDEDKWKRISSGAIQTIFADPESKRLFAGVGTSTYAISYLDNTTDPPALKTLKSDSALLSGVVYKEGYYYLSTKGDGTRGGIFKVSETDLANINTNSVQQLPFDAAVEDKDSKRMFMSMIKLKGADTKDADTIVAVERNGGGLYEIQSGSFARMLNPANEWLTIGMYANEAIALWEDPLDSDKRLLVVGIQEGLFNTTTSSHTYGYVEFELNPNDGFKTIIARRDSDKRNLLSVHDQERYMSSLGKHPVNHLLQAPRDIDENMTFFASTQKEGLWSYRDRPENGGWQWNAEAEDEPRY